jgi:hypothetical protein
MTTADLTQIITKSQQLDVEMYADLEGFKRGLLSETEALVRGARRQFERRWLEMQAQQWYRGQMAPTAGLEKL